MRQLSNSERRVLLQLLRSDDPIDRRIRDNIANILEACTKPRKGRLTTLYDTLNRNAKAWGAQQFVKGLVADMEKRNLKPRGGRTLAAQTVVAERLEFLGHLTHIVLRLSDEDFYLLNGDDPTPTHEALRKRVQRFVKMNFDERQ